MSRFSYNIKIIIICICFLIFIMFIAYEVIKIKKSDTVLRNIVYIISTICIFTTIIITSFCLSFNDSSFKGIITNINDKGGWAWQLAHDYEVTIHTENGEDICFSTPVLSSIALERKILNIAVGDQCEIKSNRFNTMYDINKIIN